MALSNLAWFVVALAEAREAGEEAAARVFDAKEAAEAAEGWIRAHDDGWFERWTVNQFDCFRGAFRSAWAGAFASLLSEAVELEEHKTSRAG